MKVGQAKHQSIGLSKTQWRFTLYFYISDNSSFLKIKPLLGTYTQNIIIINVIIVIIIIIIIISSSP